MQWPLLRVAVRGASMAPGLRDGDWLVVRRQRAGRVRARPGARVVVALPDRPLAIKRLVRWPDDGRAWVEGDNPGASTDSRQLGPLPADAVRGVVLFRYRRSSRSSA